MNNLVRERLGLKSILIERGLWKFKLSLQEAPQLLSQQPDFKEQKEWLQEIITKHEGFLVEFFPRFHCEFDFIEMFCDVCRSFRRNLS